MDRSSPEARAVAFADLVAAVEDYLEAEGWRPAVVEQPRIERRWVDAKYNYELVLAFSGTRTTPAVEATDAGA